MNNNLPSIDTTERLVHGALLKCVDGRWTVEGKDVTHTPLLVLHTTRALQHWQDRKVVEKFVEDTQELPDVKELNAAIPQAEWEAGLDGEPRAPWQKEYVVFLLSPADASIYTFLNSTVGARIAWEDRIQWMRALRGRDVFPLVELSSAPMKVTKKAAGMKMRPEFRVVDWTDLSGNATAAPQLGKPSAPVAAAPAPVAKPVVAAAPPKQIGKPVAPVTAVEVYDDDEIPF
jgi:hypothetical protein